MNQCQSVMVEPTTTTKPTTAVAPLQSERRRGPGRRKHERSRLVYRLVHVQHDSDEGLARCRNISDTGMKLDLAMSVALGTRLRIAFSAGHAFLAKVIWTGDRECGVQFDRPIDADAMLRESAAQTRAQGMPGLRLEHELTGTLRCDGRTRPIRVSELAQHALKVIHNGEVYTSARLSVQLGADRERHGVVRWSDGNVAEVMLLEPFSVGELGSVSALLPAPVA